MSPPNKRKVEELLQNLEDGTIKEADRITLMNWMRTDPAIRQAYIKHMRIVSLLHTEAEVEFGLDKHQGLSTRVRKQELRSFSYSLVAAAAVLIIIAVTAYFLRVPTLPEKEHFIHLTGAPDSSWSISSPEGTDNTGIATGTDIEIQYGTVELDFSSAVKATIEGPAQLKVLSNNSIRLTSGRAWFEVKPEGHGFSVETNQLKVIDLGTKFGVISSASQPEEVHVAQGKVQVIPLRKRASAKELTTGQAISIWISQNIKSIPFKESHFIRQLHQGTPYIHWSFDTLQNQQFASLSSIQGKEQYPIFLRSFEPKATPSPRQIPGVHGQALHLPGNRVYATSAFKGIEGGLPRTIALWVKGKPFKAERNSKAWILPGLVGWGSLNSSNGHWRVAVHEDGKAMVSFWGDWATSPLGKERSVLDDKWHHLTFVFTGKYNQAGRPEIIHYVDGVRVSSLQYSTSHTEVETNIHQNQSQQLRLGADMRTDSIKKTFPGNIDELYIFRGVLSEQQIRHLMKTNQYEASPPQKISPPLHKEKH